MLRKLSFEDDFEPSQPQSDTIQLPNDLLYQIQQEYPENYPKMIEKVKKSIRRDKNMKKKCKKEDESDDKKVVQMIRNRISAQNSRDRKKAYMTYLEEQSKAQQDENTALKQRLADLRQQGNNLSRTQSCLKKQMDVIETVKSGSRLGNIGLALLTLVSVFSVLGKGVEETVKIEDVIKIEEHTEFKEFHTPKTLIDTNTYFEDKIISDSELLHQKMCLEEDFDPYHYHMPSMPACSQYVDYIGHF